MLDSLKLLKRFARYLHPYRRRYLFIQFLHVVSNAFTLTIPMFFKFLIDDVIGKRRADLLLPLIGGLMAVILLRWLMNYLRIYHGHEIAQRVTFDMRNDLFTHLQSQSMRFYDRERTGNLLARVLDDLNIVEEVTHHGPEAILGVGPLLVGSFFILAFMNWKLALACLWVIPVQGLVTYRFGGQMQRGFRRVRSVTSSLASRLEEAFTGIQVIKSFGREEHERDRFEDVNRRHYNRRLDVIRPMASMFPLAEFFNGLSMAIALGAGGYLALQGHLTVGTLAAFVLYLRQFLFPLVTLSTSLEQITAFIAVNERFFDYFSITPEIKESPRALHIERVEGRVDFENVCFAYRENVQVLKDVTFQVPPGASAALVGPTGAGKTTIVRLLARLYDVNEGRVAIDGHDVRDLTIRTLRENIGAVMQSDVIFSGTIYDNIAYGRLEAGRDEIVEAARQANAEEFVQRLPDGYDTIVGQRGVMLSEGQRQRIAIARALLKNPRILLLDEATSSVDSETERLIQQALARLLRGRTTIAIAHRLSTILNADQILYVDQGQIVERGRHEELLARNGNYARLFYTQFKMLQGVRD